MIFVDVVLSTTTFTKRKMKINGDIIARQFRNALQTKITNWKSSLNKVPGLAVILVGDRIDSTTYVKYKQKAAEEIGMNFSLYSFPVDTTQDKIMDCIDKCNDDSNVNGIIVQLPLPKHLNDKLICERVSYSKDVDGLTLQNLAKLAVGNDTGFVACTPKGCLELIRSTGVSIEGKKATVVGRSHIVGMPMAMLLNNENATVTICHSKTPQGVLINELRQSDIVVAAVGRAEMIKGEWLKPGAVVIDVGINSIVDNTKKSGYRLIGDVEYTTAYTVASAITPVPGGVGPMTIAMLLSNTALGFERMNAN